jgi:hypothetical protein
MRLLQEMLNKRIIIVIDPALRQPVAVSTIRHMVTVGRLDLSRRPLLRRVNRPVEKERNRYGYQ